MNRPLVFGVALTALAQIAPAQAQSRGQYDGLISQHAAANGLPESLVRRVIMKESGGNARIVSAGNYGLMQIRLGTARGLGYTGSAAGLLDPDTNMTYAVRYLAGAYKVAGGNHDRAIALYQRGYYSGSRDQGTTKAPSGGNGFSVASWQWPATSTSATPRSGARGAQKIAWKWPWEQTTRSKRSVSARLQKDAYMRRFDPAP